MRHEEPRAVNTRFVIESIVGYISGKWKLMIGSSREDSS